MAKILVVDDEPDMIWALTNVLLAENHSVISVNSGEDALEKIKQVMVDLVLLDFRLPGMDGIQILEKIKQIQPGLPVVMVTGYGGVEEAVQSIKLGAAHYLPKPFDNEQLIEIVNKSLQLDNFKKVGLFGKRPGEKIDPQSAAGGEPASSPPEPASQPPYILGKLKPPAGRKFLVPALVAAGICLLIAGGVGYKIYETDRDRDYTILNSKVSGLSWGGGFLWVSDWFSQAVQQYRVQGSELTLVNNITLPGYHLTGIAWADTNLFTCDSWKKTIFKHYIDGALSVAASYPSPGPNPSGLFYDGKYLWSCDGDTRKVYQHALDDQLTVVFSFDSAALSPAGMYLDSQNFWVASARGMKIYRHLSQERFRLENIFVLPESFEIAQQLSAFTLEKDRVWLAYEGVNKIYRRNLKSLQEVTP